MRGLILVACLMATTSAFGQIFSTTKTPQDAFNEGKEFGTSQLDSTKDPLKTASERGLPGMTTGENPAEALGSNYTTNPPETSNFSATGVSILNNGGVGKQTECFDLAALKTASKEKQLECDAVRLIAGHPGSPYVLDRDADPMLKGAREVVKSAVSTTTDTNVPCNPTVNTGSAVEREDVCQEVKPSVERSCSEILTVQCVAPALYCNEGGISANSVQGDVRFLAMPNEDGTLGLQVGTPGDNYWATGVYDRTVTFNVADASKIGFFRLDSAQFDDWLWLVLNGNTIFVGPKGGDRLEIAPPPSKAMPTNTFCGQNDWNYNYTCSVPDDVWSNTSHQEDYAYCELRDTTWDGSGGTWYCGDVAPGQVQYCATCYGPQELSTSWDIPVGTDFKEYLQTGTNTLWIRLVVSGGGEFYANFTSGEYCKPVCTDNWDDQCSALRPSQATPPAPYSAAQNNTCYNMQTKTWSTCVN